MNTSAYEEDTIDLLDLFYYLLRHWRSMIALILVGGGAHRRRTVAAEGGFDL